MNAASKPRRFTLNWSAALLLAAAGCCCVLTAARAAPDSQKNGDQIRVTLDQMHQLNVVPVVTHPFRAQKLAIGQIAYNEDTSTIVLTPFAGRVTRLTAKIGDQVKRGDPLFEIDSPEVVQPQNDFIAAITAVNKAKSQLGLAQIVEKRTKGLYEDKAGPLKEWQVAQAALIAAENDMRLAATTLEAVRNRLRILGRTEDQISALENRGEIVRATPIYAPIAGTVITRKVGPGQYVRSDSNEALYTIADLSTMWLKAFVPETDIPFVRVGQEVEVRVMALPDRLFKAHITVIASASNAATRRVVVQSEVPNPGGVLKAEMFATFKITAGPDMPSPAVPIEAVIRERDLNTVWVQVSPMVFERRKVTIGLEQEGRVQIRDGLRPDEHVVARGAIFVDNEWRQ